jgi:hypothetical protein
LAAYVDSRLQLRTGAQQLSRNRIVIQLQGIGVYEGGFAKWMEELSKVDSWSFLVLDKLSPAGTSSALFDDDGSVTAPEVLRKIRRH